MNSQPLNSLTTNNNQVSESTADECGAHQALNHLGDQRQLALASLFNSLTSLANSNQQQPTVSLQHQQRQTVASSNHQQQTNQQQMTPTSTSMAALQNPLQSVMAVAMMQQQLASAVSHHHQQQPQFLTGDQISFFNQGLDNDAQVAAQQQIQQRINYCTICNKELCNKYFMKTHMLKMHGINLEMEQPENDSDGREDEEGREKSDGDGGERGLDESNDDEAGSDEQLLQKVPNEGSTTSSSWPNSNIKKMQSSNSSKKTVVQANSGKSSSQNKKQAASTAGRSQATSVMNGFAGNSMGGVVCDICNKELCSKYFLKVHKQNTHGIMTDYQDANQFMYPFANPMAGPNPFLTPASLAPPSPFTQNPLALFAGVQQPQQQQQCFDEQSISKRSNGAKRLRLSQSTKQSTSPPMVDREKNNRRGPDSAIDPDKQFESVYRLILAQQQRQQHQPQPPHQLLQLPSVAPAAVPPPPLMPIDPIGTNPLGALMCFGAIGPPGPFGSAGMSPAMIVDNILRNQHLFNRNSNNIGSSNIGQQAGTNKQTDRNNNSKADLKQTGGKISGKDLSTSNSRYFSHYTEACPMCDRRFKSIKWLKTHMMNDHKQEIGAYMQMMMQYMYTSKTQQMAAAATMAAFEQQQQQQQQQHQQHQQQQHQQHQQQQQQQNHHRDLISHFAKNQLKHNHPTSLLNKCLNPNTFQQPQANMLIDQNQIKLDITFQNQSHQQQPKLNNPKESKSPFEPPSKWSQHNSQGEDFVIDARCRQESLSPGESLNRQSPSSPTSRSHLNFGTMDNHSVCGLNFDLERLDGHPSGPENFILSGSSRAGSDILYENTGDSDRSRDGGDCQSPNQSAQQIQIKTTTS